MNLREIGKQLGLSYSTVSICLSGNPEKTKISPKTVERVRAYAKEIGYVPNLLARRLFNSTHENAPLGIIYKLDTASDRTMVYLRDMMKYLTLHKQDFVIQSCDADNILTTCRMLLGMKIRKIVILGYVSEKMLNGVEQLQDLELYVTQYISDVPCPLKQVKCICLYDQDNFLRKYAQYILDVGLGPLAVDENTGLILERSQILPEAILPISDRNDLFRSGAQMEKQVMKLIKKGHCKTILLHNDHLAIGLMEKLHARKIRIPEDVSVIGFNNSEIAAHAIIALSTIELPVWKSILKILSHIFNGEPLPQICTNRPCLIPRSSTLKPLNIEVASLYNTP